MELRRAADALVRAQASLLSPATTVRWTSGGQLCTKRFISRPHQRSISMSARRGAIMPKVTTSSAPPPSSLVAEPSSSSSEANPPPSSTSETNTPTPTSSPAEDLASLTSALGWTNPSRLSPQTVRPRQNPPWSSSSSFLSPLQEQRLNNGTSASDLLNALNIQRSARSDLLNSSRTPAFDINRMSLPPSPFPLSTSSPHTTTSPLSFTSEIERSVRLPRPPRTPLHLGPTLGRTIKIGVGIDVGRGFRLLEQSCARNGVKRDFNKQRFHERPGLKRKRLRRERWRRAFLEGFRATVGRVKALKNQGW